MTSTHQQRVNDIWGVKELLRDHYKRHQYGEVILPLTVLRRLETVLAPTRDAVVERAKTWDNPDDGAMFLTAESGLDFYNTSPLTFAKVAGDPDNLVTNWLSMLQSYSPAAREMIDRFGIATHIEKMNDAGILLAVTQRFVEMRLGPGHVTNIEMGYVYEELVRLTADLTNEEAGEHFTPREVIDLLVKVAIAGEDVMFDGHRIVKVYDPTCGTGGMLTAAQDVITSKNPDARVHLYGQEIQPESFATARADMMLEGRSATIEFGDTLLPPTFDENGERSNGDAFSGEQFAFMFANPPYGKDWKSIAKQVKKEHTEAGFAGRFGAGLPATSDGQILFLQHMVSKMLPAEDGGSRIAVVMNGSPLFSGGAGSGMSEIRRWIIENDWLDAIIGLPDQMFYNTGISTYIWVLDNTKAEHRAGRVQLIDGRQMFSKMRKSLGNKRNELTSAHIAELIRVYESFTVSDVSKIVPNESFATIEFTVERPLRQRYEVTDDALTALVGATAVKKLDDLAPLVEAVRAHAASISVPSDDEARAAVKAALASVGLKGKGLEDAVLGACAVRDETVEPSKDAKGNVIGDSALRDTESVAVPVGADISWSESVEHRFEDATYRDAIEGHMADEVVPYVPDAWVDWTKCRIGYDIPFTRLFYVYEPPRPLADIRADLAESQARILELLGEVGA